MHLEEIQWQVIKIEFVYFPLFPGLIVQNGLQVIL